jgi:hypothetical protein
VKTHPVQGKAIAGSSGQFLHSSIDLTQFLKVVLGHV